MGADIRHDGIVNSIDGQKVTVRILQASACSGCQASRICRAAESKEKLVEIEMKGADTLSVGQTVTIAGEESYIVLMLLRKRIKKDFQFRIIQ